MIEQLLQAMKEKGLRTWGLTITYTETTVGYPGGHYVNKLFFIDFGNGKTEHFDARLVIRENVVSHVFLEEVKRYL